MPQAGARAPHKAPRPHRRHPGQISRITQRCRFHGATLITTAAYTDMRWDEIAGLHWRHVDLDHATLTIDREQGALHESGGRLELGRL